MPDDSQSIRSPLPGSSLNLCLDIPGPECATLQPPGPGEALEEEVRRLRAEVAALQEAVPCRRCQEQEEEEAASCRRCQEQEAEVETLRADGARKAESISGLHRVNLEMEEEIRRLRRAGAEVETLHRQEGERGRQAAEVTRSLGRLINQLRAEPGLGESEPWTDLEDAPGAVARLQADVGRVTAARAEAVRQQRQLEQFVASLQGELRLAHGRLREQQVRAEEQRRRAAEEAAEAAQRRAEAAADQRCAALQDGVRALQDRLELLTAPGSPLRLQPHPVYAGDDRLVGRLLRPEERRVPVDGGDDGDGLPMASPARGGSASPHPGVQMEPQCPAPSGGRGDRRHEDEGLPAT